jgi:serine/threonine protein kinase
MASRIPHEHESVTSAEKIFEEFTLRQKRGETVSLEEYCNRYPNRSIALQLLADVAPECLSEEIFIDSEPLGSIGKYRLVHALGRGGFGVVYLARQPSPQRDVALKVLKSGMDSRETLARFERERQALAVLSHPNIATIFEAGETEQGRPYFVMEYVPGKPATHYCREAGLDLRGRLAIFLKVLSAVQHAHQHGILHRDLKPLNILVASSDTGAPEPKIIDFGLAKALDVDLADESMATRDGCLMGTPLYIAPEQIDSRVPVDRRADVYALGVVLYELLTDDRPFRYSGPLRYDEFRRVVLEKDPLPPSRCAARLEGAGESSRKPPVPARELRGELDWISMKALEKDPARRYSSAMDLASDLACHLNGEPIVAGPPSGIYRLRKLARRHRLKVAAVFAIVLIVAYPLYSYVSGRLLVARVVAAANASYGGYVERAAQWRLGLSHIEGTEPGAEVPQGRETEASRRHRIDRWRRRCSCPLRSHTEAVEPPRRRERKGGTTGHQGRGPRWRWHRHGQMRAS